MSDDLAFLFSGWAPILRILFVGTFAYVFLLVTLRVSGPRTLSRTNIFDFIISVGVGSAFGRIITAKDVALAEACTAFALLAFLQYLVSFLRVRSKRFAGLVNASPCLLYFDGQYLPHALRVARLAESDIQDAVRSKGLGSMSDVEAVVLEAGGELAVIRKATGSQELTQSLRK
jgi:uncharacterized membrane protein YcaP (DUF421 family)